MTSAQRGYPTACVGCVGSRFAIPDERTFESWEQLLALGRVADAVVIATQDAMHVGPAVAFAGQGYHILLEVRCVWMEGVIEGASERRARGCTM